MNVCLAILWKDLMVELRSRDRVIAMALFALLSVIVFWFALPDEGPQAVRRLAPGVLWVASLFAALLGINRSFAMELENETLEALALAPVDRGYVFLGKALANWLLLAIVQCITLFFLAIAYNLKLWHEIPALLLVVAAGSLGLASLGTLFAAIAVRTHFREVMLPLLSLPLMIPILLAAVAATDAIVAGDPFPTRPLRLIAVTDAVYLIVSFVTFEYVLDD